MRDYGVIRVRFWAWAKKKKLSLEARELALYLLSSPHGNSLGCFRLPAAYICDDLDTNAKSLAKAFDELKAVDFVRRDENDGWTWIRDYLEHNPIPNGNVAKAIGKMLEQVPLEVDFYGQLLERLDGSAISPDLRSTLSERFTNRIDTVSRGAKTHIHTHTHEHIQEHDKPAACAAEEIDESEDAFKAFLETAGAMGWPKPRALEPDRRKKLKARLAEHGLDGWKQMLQNARASDFLRTKFTLKLDWVLEPKNFRKVLEGNYGDACSDAPASPTSRDSDLQWKARTRGWRPGRFWNRGDWGPDPTEPGCRVPPAVLTEWRQEGMQ